MHFATATSNVSCSSLSFKNSDVILLHVSRIPETFANAWHQGHSDSPFLLRYALGCQTHTWRLRHISGASIAFRDALRSCRTWENLLLTISGLSSLLPVGTFQWEDQLTGRLSSVSSRSLHWPRRRIIAVLRTPRSQLPLWTSELSWCYEPDLLSHQTRLSSWNVVLILFRNVFTFSQ